jgi:hypothetical protein
MKGSLTDNFNRTGIPGITIDIGKGKEPGEFRTINLGRNHRDRNLEIKDKNNINGDQRFRDISNRYRNNKNNNNKENPRLRNLKAKNKENPRLSNHNSNKINRRTNNPRDNSNRNNSILNLGGSNRRGNHTTNSLKKNLKEGMLNIESKRIHPLTSTIKMVPIPTAIMKGVERGVPGGGPTRETP